MTIVLFSIIKKNSLQHNALRVFIWNVGWCCLSDDKLDIFNKMGFKKKKKQDTDTLTAYSITKQ